MRLAKIYLEVNQKRKDKLKSCHSLDTKDSDTFLFAMAIGGDGPPGTGMVILVLFLNVGERLPSSKEQFLLFGGAVTENLEIVSNFFKVLIKDVRFLESNIFEIATHSGIHKVEFKLAEHLSDMKMVAFLAGELSNDATYFCTFANVRRNESNDCKKTFAKEPKNYLEPFTYEKPLQDAKKVEVKSKQLGKKSSAVDSNILAYIANELKSRQYKQPIVEEFILPK